MIPANGGAWEDLVLTLPMSGTAALTDASFERMAKRFVENTPRTKTDGGVKLALGAADLGHVVGGHWWCLLSRAVSASSASAASPSRSWIGLEIVGPR